MPALPAVLLYIKIEILEMKITSTELTADDCKDQEKICGRIIHNMKCVGSNMVLSSATKSDQSKLSEKVTSAKYETVNP